MSRSYQVIDSDGHILEPIEIWRDYVDSKFRQRAPSFRQGPVGNELLVIDGKTVTAENVNMGSAGHAEGAADLLAYQSQKYADGRKGGFDPHARIEDLDLDGIDAAFLFPTVGLKCASIDDPELAAAICRGYNRWLADYCSHYPDRLFGVAMAPMQSVDLAIKEMQFARKTLGMRAVCVRPNPYHGKMIGHQDYDPFWAAAQDLDMSVAFHEGGSGGAGSIPAVGVDRFDDRGALHIASHTMEMMLVAISVIWNGVCERFPRIRVGFMESGGGWIAPWLDRMERHFSQGMWGNTSITMRPRELFQRNCWISFEPVEESLAVLADYIGPNKILWATDYPHPDGFFPGAPQMIRSMPGLSEKTRQRIFVEGAKEFYGLA